MGQLGTTLMNALHPAGCQINITCVEIDTLVNKEMGHMNRGPHWMDMSNKMKDGLILLSFLRGPIFMVGQTSIS